MLVLLVHAYMKPYKGNMPPFEGLDIFSFVELTRMVAGVYFDTETSISGLGGKDKEKSRVACESMNSMFKSMFQDEDLRKQGPIFSIMKNWEFLPYIIFVRDFVLSFLLSQRNEDC